MSHSSNMFANLGAEQGESWRRAAEVPEVAAAAALFESLGREPAAFPWLAGPARLHAWLNTEEALARAKAAGLALAGAAPACVGEVHDKAFAHRVALQEGLHPPELAPLVRVLDPDELADPAAFLAELTSVVEGWPAWTGGRFTLKPRHGSSGRGRVGGRLADLAPDTLAGALPRLADRGGAMLEPWLERSADVSAQLHLGEDGALTLLGTTTLWVAASGAYRGHRGTLDTRGRVTSGSRHDEALREAAVAVATAAAARGLRGPCGLDGLAFRAEGREHFRPVVELNARFTMGTVAIGLLRRALPGVVKTLQLRASRRLAFHFAPTAPAGGWPECPAGCLRIDLDAPGAALWVAPDFEALDALLGPIA